MIIHTIILFSFHFLLQFNIKPYLCTPKNHEVKKILLWISISSGQSGLFFLPS